MVAILSRNEVLYEVLRWKIGPPSSRDNCQNCNPGLHSGSTGHPSVPGSMQAPGIVVTAEFDPIRDDEMSCERTVPNGRYSWSCPAPGGGPGHREGFLAGNQLAFLIYRHHAGSRIDCSDNLDIGQCAHQVLAQKEVIDPPIGGVSNKIGCSATG